MMQIKRIKIPAFISLLYFVFALISFNFSTIADGSAALVWLPSGLAVAAVVYCGLRLLPGIYLAGVLASLYIENSIELSLLFAAANMLEPLVAWLILNRVQFSLKLYHFKDYILFILAGICGAMLSALIGGSALVIFGELPLNLFFTTSLNWWVGNVVGILLVAPSLLFLAQTSVRTLLQGRYAEFSLLLLVATYLAITEFAGISIFGGKTNIEYAPFVIAVFLWAVIRFNHQAIALIQMMFLTMGIWGFLNYQGYFFNDMKLAEYSIDFLFQYIFLASFGAMSLAYTLKHQRALSQALTKSKMETYIFNKDDFQLEFINISARLNLGVSGRNWHALSILDLQTDEAKEVFVQAVNQLKETDSRFESCISRLQRVDGTSYPVEMTLEQVEQSGHTSYLVTAIDISDRIETQLYKDLGDSVCHHSTQGVVICDENNVIIRANNAFSQITGYSEQEVIGHEPNMFSSGKHDRLLYVEMWEKLEENLVWHGELYNRHKLGRLYLVDITIKKVIHELGNKAYYMAMFTDITAEREQSLKLKHHAEHDLLTALPNRTRLQKEFTYASAMAKRQEKKLALLFLDLDAFKPINDAHGHHFGDQVLQAVATVLNDSVRDSDIVSRIGGDEFVILMTNLDHTDDCQLIKDKIKAVIAEPMLVAERMLELSVSIGIAVYPSDGSELHDLTLIADQAMYKDKQAASS